VIAEAPHRSGGHKESHVQGWLISVLLHGTVALTVILAVKQIQLTPQDDAFKWNVAMVSPAQQIQPTASSSTQAPARSAPSTTSTSSPPLRRGTPTQTLTQQAVPSISERTPTAMVTEPPPPQLTTPLPSAAHTIQSVEPIRQETVASIAAAAESLVKPDDTPTAVSSSTDAVTGPSSAQSTAIEQTPQSEHTSAQTQMAAISPAPTNVPAKRDYRWLSEAILRRMEELKRYPASARVDRAEGKVVVKAVIGEDGSISEVGVFLSSGHIALDEAAVETMRQAAPFHLPHPLGQPRMTIKIPMSYRLDR
jgi:protein TonB